MKKKTEENKKIDIEWEWLFSKWYVRIMSEYAEEDPSKHCLYVIDSLKDRIKRIGTIHCNVRRVIDKEGGDETSHTLNDSIAETLLKTSSDVLKRMTEYRKEND